MYCSVRGWVACAAALAVMGCAFAERGSFDKAELRPELNSPADAAERGGLPDFRDAGAGPQPGRYRHPGSGVAIDVVSLSDLRGWADDDHAAALSAFLVTCDRMDTVPDGTSFGGIDGYASDWRGPCAAARKTPATAARQFFEAWFSPLRFGGESQGVVTAYFEPTLRASRTRSGPFQHPIYRTPPEVERDGATYGTRMADGRLTPFFSRGDIDQGALVGRGLEIAYLDDAIDLFFLHIQGSGRLDFVDGGDLRVGFAAKNGWPYRSVGQELLRRNLAPNGDASADGIRRFYELNPAAGQALLAENPSYIFFREVPDLDPASGPIGALGVQLVAGRSLAVDRAFTPLGAPVWLETDSPLGPIRKLMAAHDTGSAIVGPQRADYYWGAGDEAGRLAGRMKHAGTITTLLPNALANRVVGGTS